MKKNILIIIIIMMTIIIFKNNNSHHYYQYNENTYLAVIVDGTETNSFPEKGSYNVNVSCKDAIGKWNYDEWKLNVTNINNFVKCSINFKSIELVRFNDFIINMSTNSSSTGVYNEKGYRYEGKDPNNWLLFNEEYWRIIGVFDEETHGKTGQNLIKIIREDSIGALSWTNLNSNDWSKSNLKNLLNTNYYEGTNESTFTNCHTSSQYNSMQGNCNFVKDGIKLEKYRNMIENVTWKLGGQSTTAATLETYYVSERGTNVYTGISVSVEGKIGLMYPSDYGYATLSSSCPRSTFLSSYGTLECGGQSWLYGKGSDWTLTHNNTSFNTVYSLDESGVLYSYGYVSYAFSIRPVLYLKQDVKKQTGDGSFENPYIITMEP